MWGRTRASTVLVKGRPLGLRLVQLVHATCSTVSRLICFPSFFFFVSIHSRRLEGILSSIVHLPASDLSLLGVESRGRSRGPQAWWDLTQMRHFPGLAMVAWPLPVALSRTMWLLASKRSWSHSRGRYTATCLLLAPLTFPAGRGRPARLQLDRNIRTHCVKSLQEQENFSNYKEVQTCRR